MKKLLVILFFTLPSLLFNLCEAQTISTVAGNDTGAYAGDGGQATSAELYHPAGVTLDALGNIYIADYYNNRIRKVNTSGIISTIAGNGYTSSGFGGYSGDGGAATSAELNWPSAITWDASGNFYIADLVNNRIRKVNTSGIISTFAGNGTGGYSGDGGLASNAEINSPMGVALDASMNLYIADWLNSVIRIVNTSGIISTFAGNGTYGFSGDGAQATGAELYFPYGLVVDAIGNVYVADGQNNRIRKINTSGIISTFAGNGTQGFSGDGGQATGAELSLPGYIALDALENVYIADEANNRIRIVNTSGLISTYAGNGVESFSGDGGPATNAEFSFFIPCGIALDASGNAYIADDGNNRIRKVTAITGINNISPSSNEVNIYPNPSTGIFNIAISHQLSAISSTEVFNVLGEKVYALTTLSNPSQFTIDLRSQPNGVYFYRVLGEDRGVTGEGKLVVDR